MLFLKLVIAAALAVTVSASPLEKDSISTDNTVLQRRAAVVEVFGKRSGQSACGFCNSVECQTPNSRCPAMGCCN
ncbi:uncharacterized protein MELLADRAFT_87935 [Melampsora larici-populina 98AG31]|uniref:Secreted protein n=1 Tax=Melampsora larici-populina (strain 98AG31 / pathotype 3-4-7) TaxID=747676 RepID=F4S988_MELLP|nr:uncharacterized protein MELLADRAFT_95419 [Melampsora larici-populina 98AG31]XP_007419619.1 uncharacterized protein MELLADRAFT_87935 [Melampsora larici-populina 98AG31]EGF97113.1 secreted protein [Melampsora larici-populina 98AG31]EGF98807.1 secreted protein [Melampsora larici-populina 98AG31]